MALNFIPPAYAAGQQILRGTTQQLIRKNAEAAAKRQAAQRYAAEQAKAQAARKARNSNFMNWGVGASLASAPFLINGQQDPRVNNNIDVNQAPYFDGVTRIDGLPGVNYGNVPNAQESGILNEEQIVIDGENGALTPEVIEEPQLTEPQLTNYDRQAVLSKTLDPSTYYTHPGERPKAPYTTGLRMLAGSFQGQPGGLGMMGGAAAGAASGLESRHANLMEGYKYDHDNYTAGMQAYRDAMLKAKEEDAVLADEVGQFDAQLNEFRTAYEGLGEMKVTGWWDNTFKKGIDNLGLTKQGAENAGLRLTLENLKVSDALLRIAQTKGAISNKEMEMFLKPSPGMFQDEKIWRKWIEHKYQKLAEVRNRLANRTTVTDLGMAPATVDQINRFSNIMSGNDTTGSSTTDYSDVDEIVGLK